MSLHYRKRGEIWHVRGTVRVGNQIIEVAERSTGCRARSDAEAVGAAEEARIRGDILQGPGNKTRRITIAECILTYGSRPGGIAPYDADRLADFNDRIGHYAVADAKEAWGDWLKGRGSQMAPGTVARWRAVLQAAIIHTAQHNQFDAPRDQRTVDLT